MTATLPPDTQAPDEVVDDLVASDVAPDAGERHGFEPDVEVEEEVERVSLREHARPLIAAALSAGAAGLVSGGIFGVWGARLLCFGAAAVGVGWAALTLRSPKRATLFQGLLLPFAFVLGIISLIPAAEGASALPTLVSKAIASGRLLRPPVPFDAGWRPILIMLFVVVGFGSAWLATELERPKLGLALPLPLLGLTAITQPAEGEFIAGLCAFLPLLAAVAVLFGGDTVRASELTSQFELKRAIRGALAAVPILAVVVALNNASFLFPAPVYDPADKPQKPKAIPISQAVDRVLFEVKTDSQVTGPWRTGVLDVYDSRSWRLPPFDTKRFEPLPSDGVVHEDLLPSADTAVTFTVRDLGDNATMPGLAAPAKIAVEGPHTIVFDPRVDVFRVPTGRVPAGITYTITMPAYPQATSLEAATPIDPKEFAEYLEVPRPPTTVRNLLQGAPENPWKRLDFLRKKLQEVVIATGGGSPKDVPPSKVEQLLSGNHEGSPYEIVAAEALLARWAGVPSRIGFGFDGVNDEDGALTVRPKNSAQWLEVYFTGHGWIPLIGAPPKAKAELDTDPNARFNPTTEPSDEVAVELYLPLERESLRQLYETVRAYLFMTIPYLLGLFVIWLAWPPAQKQWRRSKRRRWAASRSPRIRVAVEYAEFRDLATDLNVGDAYDTPIEYLDLVVEDDEHEELAWLVARALYGDMRLAVTDRDAQTAEELSASLRRRMFRAQPFQSQVLAVLSRASLRQPFTTEIPNVRQLELGGRVRSAIRRALPKRRRRRGTARRRGLLGRIPVFGRSA